LETDGSKRLASQAFITDGYFIDSHVATVALFAGFVNEIRACVLDKDFSLCDGGFVRRGHFLTRCACFFCPDSAGTAGRRVWAHDKAIHFRISKTV
jgi:hypothetical protein